MEESISSLIEKNYAALETSGRFKKMPPPGLVSLSSNDYLGLSRNPLVIEASLRATRNFGTGATGSRYLSGNHPLNRDLSDSTSQFKTGGKGTALVFSSGYHANLATVSMISEFSPLVFSDSENHASLIDGMRNLKGRKVVYPHNNPEFIREYLKENPQKKPVIVTESLFSMRGDLAPLRALFEIAEEYDGILVIDEAHATGTTGISGRGALEALGLPYVPGRMILTGTYSKALGSLGGFVILHEKAAKILESTARTLIYTTALPPGVLAASLEAIRVLAETTEIVRSLQRESQIWNAYLQGDTESSSPIIPVRGDVPTLQSISDSLRTQGYHLPVITYPTVPRGEDMLRLSVNIGWDKNVRKTLETLLPPGKGGQK
ncbi:MAG: aminotransferase class I/II-fold pyridoxal phosphate-dependent enzyme [Nitrospiraceae bacterium]|jgi:7-keto-8-aminopelargonate synthetase-like enzyme|nr:aminotransferase class I/II-fold pyridoxal phosphate-dependent enzyme [Nitrospiraceae bacterium]